MLHGVVKSRFPHDVGPSRLMENGFIGYRRRSVEDYVRNPSRDAYGTTAGWMQGGDEFIVPYNPYALLWTKTHLNVEIAATVNVIGYLYK